MIQKTRTERFCRDILTLNIAHRQAVANLVMALASFKGARSVTAVSESPLFAHQYSSITAAISGLAKNNWEQRHVQRVLQEFWQKYFEVGRVIHWQTDVVNVFREYAPCLRERQYRHKANNVISGNKALGLGYPLSEVNWADPESGWSVPFAMRRIGACEDEALVGAEQIKALCERAAAGRSAQSKCLRLQLRDGEISGGSRAGLESGDDCTTAARP